jgi:hypothetical protein
MESVQMCEKNVKKAMEKRELVLQFSSSVIVERRQTGICLWGFQVDDKQKQIIDKPQIHYSSIRYGTSHSCFIINSFFLLTDGEMPVIKCEHGKH